MDSARILQLGVLSRILVWTILIALSIIMVLPFLWMISTSFKPATEVIAWPPNMIPIHATLENYAKLRTAAPFARFFFNSLLMSTVSTIASSSRRPWPAMCSASTSSRCATCFSRSS